MARYKSPTWSLIPYLMQASRIMGLEMNTYGNEVYASFPRSTWEQLVIKAKCLQEERELNNKFKVASIDILDPRKRRFYIPSGCKHFVAIPKRSHEKAFMNQ